MVVVDHDFSIHCQEFRPDPSACGINAISSPSRGSHTTTLTRTDGRPSERGQAHMSESRRPSRLRRRHN